MSKLRYRNADECFEKEKQRIINDIQHKINLINNELNNSSDKKLNEVHLVTAFNKNTGEYELINIKHKDSLLSDLNSLEKQLADIDKIEQQARHITYRFTKKLPHKDNAGYINSDYYGGYMDSKIRVPSLKRKTAWKRFYKMFPGLKGEDYICGHSTGGAKRASFIKLKKM